MTFPKGFVIKGTACGIKKKGNDIGLVYAPQGCIAAGFFTKNRVQAAPVVISKDRIKKGSGLNAILVNSGCANACTGKKGMQDAVDSIKILAQKIEKYPAHIVVASTGPIGTPLPMTRIKKGIFDLTQDITHSRASDVRDFAHAIMTTDTVPKTVSRSITIAGKSVNIWGAAKGSGMIHPNMATMLGFILTDANITKQMLKGLAKDAVEDSFNTITVDGDTSTNDSVFVLASGKAENRIIAKRRAEYNKLYKAIHEVMLDLAIMIAKDGEGATKLIRIITRGCKTKQDADRIGKTIATSPLVKTAFFAGNPNSGRMLGAIGKSGVSCDSQKIDLAIDGFRFVRRGEIVQKIPKRFKKLGKEITVEIDIHSGKASRTVYTCDFSYDYVKINAEYYT